MMMLMTMATGDDYDDDDDGARTPILGPLSEGRWTRHPRKKLVLSKVAVALRAPGSGHLTGNCS